MKLLKAHIVHFGSYKDLEFEFNDQGLALIHGNTGSGKSTLQDIPTWCILGVTAKGGNADEVKSWTADGPTKVVLSLEYNGIITVHRTRGTPAQNDLYWTEGDDPTEHRGKDIKETQTLLNKRLGISEELYIAAAYYNEFSPTGTFFRAKAKDRRELFEGIANLEFPAKIAEHASEARKTAKKDIADAKNALTKTQVRLERAKQSLKDSEESAIRYDKEIALKIQEHLKNSENFQALKDSKVASLQAKASKWESDRDDKIKKLIEKVEHLGHKIDQADSKKCPTCGNQKEPTEGYQAQSNSYIEQIESLTNDLNPYLEQIEQAKSQDNHYLQLAENEKSRKNPFLKQIETYSKEIPSLEAQVALDNQAITQLEARYEALDRLYDLSFTLRGQLLHKAVKSVQDATNGYLEKYFDAEIRVEFTPDGADDIQITIQKSSHLCVYTQLSKGQRCMLRLAFSVSVMKSSANKAGIHFDNLFFDESLEGLDPSLKVKAFGLFSELALEHSSVFVVEHSVDLQNLFDKQYHVTLVDDCSNITLT